MIALLSLIESAAAAERPAPFTVSDSISMVRLADPDTEFGLYLPPTLKFAPDHSKLAIVTYRGNVNSGTNEYALTIYDTSSIESFLRSTDGSFSSPPPVVQLTTESSEHAIDQVTWVDSGSTLAFIGRDRSGVGQVYTYSLQTKALRKITSHPTNILRFALSDLGQLVVFCATEPPDWSQRQRDGYYVVDGELLHHVALQSPVDAQPVVRYFVQDVASGVERAVAGPDNRVPQNIAISPDAAHAVALFEAQRVPVAWLAYESIRRRYQLITADPHDVTDADGIEAPNDSIRFDAFGRTTSFLNQFYTLDLRAGTSSPLIDAPALSMLGAGAVWIDSSTVVFGPTLMPLSRSAATPNANRDALVIAEVDLRTGNVRPIAAANGAEGSEFALLDHAGGGTIRIWRRQGIKADPVPSEYRKVAGKWRSMPRSAVAHGDLDIRIAQNANSPPELVAEILTTHSRKLISDFNPQFRQLALDRVESFSWADRLGRTHLGGLVLPPAFQSGVRYPLVIQKYGFQPDEFLVDGSFGSRTALAARALATRGFVVAQLPNLYRPAATLTGRYEVDGDIPQDIAGTEALIDALNARGIIDPQKVALTGFSRDGMRVQAFLTFSKYPIAAATIADSVAETPFCYAMFYGAAPPGMTEWERPTLMGAPFFGKGVQLWLERSPIFHLDQIRTPIRIEHHGLGLPCHADAFAILRRERRPVEMLRFMSSPHRLRAPREVMLSQQGVIDWYAFWLMDEEDPHPNKVEQYRRWRALRVEQERNTRSQSAVQR